MGYEKVDWTIYQLVNDLGFPVRSNDQDISISAPVHAP